MDSHVLEFYSTYSEETPQGHFHQVLPLHIESSLSWEQVSQLAPTIIKGWYELAHLSSQDRIDFTKEFWLTKLPYDPCPLLPEFLNTFFGSLDDIGIFLTQQSYGDPFIPHLVYSLSDNQGFYRGEIQARPAEIDELKNEFSEYILPVDYLAFLQIHNGFAKINDTGIIPTAAMKTCYDSFQANFPKDIGYTTPKSTILNPKTLIPFYESFGMHSFQCFWGEWYPEQEMGNVYYSSRTGISYYYDNANDGIKNLAFKTFTEWLMFYLEKIVE